RIGRIESSNCGNITWNEYNFANIFFYSYSPTVNGHLQTYARGYASSNVACGGDQHAVVKDYTEIDINYSPDRWYTYSVDKIAGHHAYAEFYWYPGELRGNRYVYIELRDITIYQEWSGSIQPKSSVSKLVTITRPSMTPSISGGTMATNGEVSVSCSASGADEIKLYINGSCKETKSGSNVTFTGKYPSTENDFLDGQTFRCYAYRHVSEGRTSYVYESPSLTSQRTGVFTGDLNASVEKCGDVKLTWQIQNPSTTSDVNTSGFTLQMKNDDDWSNISSEIPYTSQSGDTKDYSYTYRIPDIDLNKGTVNRQFRVKRNFAEWDEKSFLQRTTDVNINTDFKQLSEIEIKPGGADGYPRLSWKMTTEGIECSDNISLKLKLDGATEITIPKEDILAGSYQTTGSSDGVLNCTSQRYELILQYGTLSPVTYLVSYNYVYEPTGRREFEKIVVSKGYYADRNIIKWYLRDGYDDFSRFLVMRKEAGAPDDEYITLSETTHTNRLQYTHDDRDINAGVYYIYKVEGIYECAEETGSLSSPVSIGFSQPYGSVSGRVTYTGSQAVRNVEIKVATDNAMNSSRELEFNSVRTGSLVSIPAGAKLFSAEGFTFEAWLKFLSSSEQTLLSNSLLTVKRGTNNKIAVTLANGSTLTVPENIPVGEYVHLSITVEKQSNYKNYAVTAYINDSAYVTANVTLSHDAVTPVAATKLGETFIGYMDDIRLWSRVLTAEEVALNYDRVLGGKETGLAAYYKFDEIDAAESALFDCSATGTDFNGNHAEKGAGVARATVPISASHLSIKGVTDDNGNYSIISCIPYTSEGTTYTLSPSLVGCANPLKISSKKVVHL
ncbi:MAG: LamG domain-containing protein, partial [Bacteroidales bacterium]|nr:LamG domain-containing protein [Bacteroidales bacterium]